MLRELAALTEAGKRSNPEKGVEQALHATLQSHPYLQILVPLLLERGDPGARKFALLMAQTAKTPEMLAALRDFALSQNGTDQMRLDAANAAAQAGCSIPAWCACGYAGHGKRSC